MPPSLDMTPSNSFLEKMQDISIVNIAASVIVATVNSMNNAVIAHPPTFSRRANTFNSEAPPPILDMDAATLATADHAADE